MSSVSRAPPASGLRMSDFGELHHATMGCITSLEACLSVKPLMRKGWAESRLADMNLWASSVGALAKPETSLDQRLKFQPGPRIVLNNFLLTLQAFIGSCRMHALNGAGGRKLDEAEPDDTPVSPTESAFESTLDDDSELAQLIAWGSGPKTGSDTSTDSNAEDEVDEQSSETTLDKAMGDVDDLLDQLIMLGFAIRKSGTAARLRKADASFRDDENNDLRKHLVFILLKDVAKRQIDEVDMKVKVEEFMAKKDFHNVPPEQQHLILANLRRRHRFGYARRHQQKLDQPMVKPLAVQPQSALQPVPQPVVREPTLEDQRHHTVNNQKSSPTEGPPNAMLSTITRQTPHNGDLSETAPSTAEGDILKTIPFQAAASRVSVSVAKMHYPSPPPVGQQTKGFKCPCCYQTLPAMFQDPFRWKKHLTEDLRPYTCPFLECPRPEDLYISRAAWRDHIFGTHGAGEYWECLPCAGTRTPNRFPSVEEFITHNRTKHRDTISEDQISDLQDSCRKIAPPEISQCPLCPWPQDENPEPDASTTLEHIANCIHEFSLHALPWTKSYGVQTSNPPSYAVQRWLQTPEETDIRGLRESNITDVLLHSRFIDEPKASPEEREPLYVLEDYFAEDSHRSSQVERETPSSDDDLPDAKGMYPGNLDQPDINKEYPNSLKIVRSRHFMVPFGRNGDFVGRGAILEQLLERIPPSANQDDCQHTAVEGLGGIGKTQVALEAAYQVRDTYPDCSVFWVPAVDLTSFENAYREIGKLLNIPGIDDDKANVKVLVKAGLEHVRDGSWLLIIDNADDIDMLFQDAELANYLPFSRQGSILFTTRNHQVTVQLDIPQKNIITIQEMNNAEATKLLQIGLKESQMGDAKSTKYLLQFLANLPLAIKQASAYMASNINVTVSQYLEFCESSNINLINLLSKQFEDRHRYKGHARNQNPVATTWLISFEHILRYNPQAADYLKFVCFLAEKDIPLSLLPVASKMQMAEAIGLLSAYAFILERDTPGSFDIHRLIRLVMRSWLQENGEWEKWTVNVVQRLIEEYPSPRHENRKMWTKYLPHGQAVLEVDGTVNTEEKSSLLFNIAESYSILGKYNNAEQLYRQTLELREGVLGREHPSTLASMNNLANVLGSQGKYKEAETMHRQTLELKEGVLGREHPSTLDSMNNLALVLGSQGKYKEAETMHRQTLELKEGVLGREHLSTLDSMNNLAEVLRSQGKYEEAETILASHHTVTSD